VRLLREQGAPWGPESPAASALHTSGSARPISPPPGMMPARQRGFYSEVLDAELEPTSQADLKQVRPAPPVIGAPHVAAWLEWLPVWPSTAHGEPEPTLNLRQVAQQGSRGTRLQPRLAAPRQRVPRGAPLLKPAPPQATTAPHAAPYTSPHSVSLPDICRSPRSGDV